MLAGMATVALALLAIAAFLQWRVVDQTRDLDRGAAATPAPSGEDVALPPPSQRGSGRALADELERTGDRLTGPILELRDEIQRANLGAVAPTLDQLQRNTAALPGLAGDLSVLIDQARQLVSLQRTIAGLRSELRGLTRGLPALNRGLRGARSGLTGVSGTLLSTNSALGSANGTLGTIDVTLRDVVRALEEARRSIDRTNQCLARPVVCQGPDAAAGR